jgi:hypothetical protein
MLSSRNMHAAAPLRVLAFCVPAWHSALLAADARHPQQPHTSGLAATPLHNRCTHLRALTARSPAQPPVCLEKRHA